MAPLFFQPMKTLAEINFNNFESSIYEALDAIGAGDFFASEELFLIKPNLVNSSRPPVTTPVEAVAAVITYIRKHNSNCEIVVAEGCGDARLETADVFSVLGYDELAREEEITLVDLNHAPLKRLENPSCKFFPEMYLPEIAFSHKIISVPTLKAHSLARITGSIKNMMGFAPPKHYSGQGGMWKKAVFHLDMQNSLKDLASYRIPDITVMDGSVGLAEYHLGGPEFEPPLGKILASFDPYEVDRRAADFLEIDWRNIGHLIRPEES